MSLCHTRWKKETIYKCMAVFSLEEGSVVGCVVCNICMYVCTHNNMYIPLENDMVDC